MEAAIAKKRLKNSDLQMFASFRLGKAELALSIKALQEVVNFPERISRVPLAPDFLLGLFNLRGNVTPIVDMAKLLNLPSDSAAVEKKVAVIIIENVRIGLLFDATSEILNVLPEDISVFEEAPSGKKSVVKSALKLNGGERLVEVIDPLALLKIENIPQVLAHSKNNVIESARKNFKRCQCITFRSGPLGFGLSIAAIGEIIKVPEIKKSVLAVDYCVGMVSLRGSIIPILDFKKFLKIEGGEVVSSDLARIVVLKLDRLQIGILVESVDSIVTFFEDEILPIPLFGQDKIEMMRGLLPDQKSGDVIFLNETKIFSNDEILQITRGHDSLYGKQDESVQAALKKVSDRKPYLSFQLDYLLSTRLSAIDEIAKLDENLLKPPGYPEYIVGMMKMRGEAIMVVDLRSYYQMKPLSERTDPRVLVVKGAKARYGLLVDAVDSINTIDEANKIDIPPVVAQGAANVFKGDMTGIVETKDAAGVKKTFMILDVAELLKKFEGQIV